MISQMRKQQSNELPKPVSRNRLRKQKSNALPKPVSRNRLRFLSVGINFHSLTLTSVTTLSPLRFSNLQRPLLLWQASVLSTGQMSATQSNSHGHEKLARFSTFSSTEEGQARIFNFFGIIIHWPNLKGSQSLRSVKHFRL